MSMTARRSCFPLRWRSKICWISSRINLSRRGLRRLQQNLGREMQPRDELPDHREAQGPLPAQHLRNLAFAAEVRDQILGLKPCLLHPEPQSFNRVGQVDGVRFVFVGVDQE